ncbi:MAG: hypothetical protein Q8878_08065 [Bacillota bacterium]|nr:hypothetical protein [Bacillota bacterium]
MTENKKLIVMLTWHDVTVKNAKEIFLGAKDAAASDWGFKIEGTTPESMAELTKLMKASGKRTYIEVLAIDEPSCIEAANLCVKCGVDHLLGTVYYESVQKICAGSHMAYSPFIGLDSDTRLRGTVDEIIAKAHDAEKKGITGVNLSGFRYVSGDPAELISRLAPTLKKPFTIAGSVDSYEKIDLLKKAPNLYGFTIGGAFFEHKFGDTFAQQINAVCEYLRK